MFTKRFQIPFSLLLLVCVGTCAWRFTPQIRAGSPLVAAAGHLAASSSANKAKSNRHTSPALQALHDRYVKAFVDSEGFGLSRLARFDDPFRQSIELDGDKFTVQRLELVSLQNHEIPVAYVNHFANPVRNRYKAAETRSLTDFEQSSLKKLQSGEEFLFDVNHERARIVGAIRSRTMCLECHDGKVGDLLGAFTYELKPGAANALRVELSTPASGH